MWKIRKDKRVKVILRNEFHNTRCVVLARYRDQYTLELTDQQMYRASRVLCPYNGCECYVFRGDHWPRVHIVEKHHHGWYLIDEKAYREMLVSAYR